MDSIQGQVVVITGAAGGIGAALSRRLSTAGARLALVDWNKDALYLLADELGPDHLPIVQDLAEVESFPVLVATVRETLGPISMLINNAGLTVYGPFVDQTPLDLDRILDVDLRAVMHMTHAVMPQLMETKGRLVLVSSMAGLHGFPMQAGYSAAKFGVRGFGQAMRAELASRGVTVTTVMPGTVATPFLSNAGSVDPKMSTIIGSLMTRYGAPSDHVAGRILRAVERGQAEMRIGWDCIALGWLEKVAPSVLPRGLSLAMRLHRRKEK